MNLRDECLNALRRQGSKYIPFEFSLCPFLQDEFTKRTGMTDYEEYYQFPMRSFDLIGIEEHKQFYTQYYEDLTDITLDIWGVGYKKGSTYHFAEMQHPLKNFVTLEEFAQFPYPDSDKDFDWVTFEKNINETREKNLVTTGWQWGTIFEYAWYLRGMDNFMIDLMINPELAEYQMDRIVDVRCMNVRRMAEMGVDIIRLGDDVSTQLDMMISPEMWRKYLKPRLAKVIQAAKKVKPDVLIFYHGDGNLQKIIPDLIEIGVDLLNPVQPECMDPVEIKQQYGDKISLWGTLGTQTTLPFGSPEEVTEVSKRMIDIVGLNGGLLLSPSHLLEPEVPWENIEAFIHTVKTYNDKYQEET